MITVHFYRDNGGGEHHHEREQTRDEALHHMVEFEYGYGGHPVQITPTLVEVHTQILACHDRVVWEGSVDEMAPLVEVSQYFAATFTKNVNDALAEVLAPKLLEITKGNPLLVTGLAGMFVGKARLKTVCILWCDGLDLTAEAVTKAEAGRLSRLQWSLHSGLSSGRAEMRPFLKAADQSWATKEKEK